MDLILILNRVVMLGILSWLIVSVSSLLWTWDTRTTFQARHNAPFLIPTWGVPFQIHTSTICKTILTLNARDYWLTCSALCNSTTRLPVQLVPVLIIRSEA